MKSNPKTIAGVIVLVILAAALGFLLSRLFPTIGEVQREMSLTPTPLPDIPGSVMAVTDTDAAAGYSGQRDGGDHGSVGADTGTDSAHRIPGRRCENASGTFARSGVLY